MTRNEALFLLCNLAAALDFMIEELEKGCDLAPYSAAKIRAMCDLSGMRNTTSDGVPELDAPLGDDKLPE